MRGSSPRMTANDSVKSGKTLTPAGSTFAERRPPLRSMSGDFLVNGVPPGVDPVDVGGKRDVQRFGK